MVESGTITRKEEREYEEEIQFAGSLVRSGKLKVSSSPLLYGERRQRTSGSDKSN